MSCDQRRVTTSGHIWWNRRDTSASTHQSWRSDGAHEQEQQENTEKHLLSTTWNTAKHNESTIKCQTTSEQLATSSTQEPPGPSAPSWWSNLDCWLKYQDYQFEKSRNWWKIQTNMCCCCPKLYWSNRAHLHVSLVRILCGLFMSIDAQTSTCNFIARERAQTLRTMLSFSVACCADTARHAMLPQILSIRCQSERWTATTQHNPNIGTSFHVSPITFARLPITDLRMDHRIRAHVHGLLCIKSMNWPKFQICINVACWAPSLRATGSVKRYPLCSLEINTSSTTVTMLLHMRTQHHSHRNSTMAWLGIVLVKTQVVQCDMHVPRILLENQHEITALHHQFTQPYEQMLVSSALWPIRSLLSKLSIRKKSQLVKKIQTNMCCCCPKLYWSNRTHLHVSLVRILCGLFMSIDAQTSTCNFIARKRAQTLRTVLSFSVACCADTARHAMLPLMNSCWSPMYLCSRRQTSAGVSQNPAYPMSICTLNCHNSTKSQHWVILSRIAHHLCASANHWSSDGPSNSSTCARPVVHQICQLAKISNLHQCGLLGSKSSCDGFN